MKIAVVLPSRSHPHRLVAVVTALDHLTSGRHEVGFHIFIDDDDESTQAALDNLSWIQSPVHAEVGPRQVLHFQRINQTCLSLEMDAMTWFTDDVFPLTLHWDDKIANAIGSGDLAVAWKEVADPNHVTFPILSRRWIETLGYVFPEYFPFWFVDTWIMETYELAFCSRFPIIQNLQVGGRRGGTAGMHDLLFWFQFFDATRCERVRDAQRAAETLATGATESQMADIVAAQHRRVLNQIARVPEFERRFGADTRPKSDRYLQLKIAAENWLQSRALTQSNRLNPK